MSIYRGGSFKPGGGDGFAPFRSGGHVLRQFSGSTKGKQLDGASTQHKYSSCHGSPINLWKHLSIPGGWSMSWPTNHYSKTVKIIMWFESVIRNANTPKSIINIWFWIAIHFLQSWRLKRETIMRMITKLLQPIFALLHEWFSYMSYMLNSVCVCVRCLQRLFL